MPLEMCARTSNAGQKRPFFLQKSGLSGSLLHLFYGKACIFRAVVVYFICT